MTITPLLRPQKEEYRPVTRSRAVLTSQPGFQVFCFFSVLRIAQVKEVTLKLSVNCATCGLSLNN